MTESKKIHKAIEVFEKPSKHIKCVHKCENGMEFLTYSQDLVAAFETAISALEKQIPKKPKFEINLGDYTSRFICECGKKIVVKHDSGVMDNHDAPNYCPNCGQRLNWSDTD